MNKTNKKQTRTKTGTHRAVRSDTKVSTIEKKYGVELGVRADMKVGNYLKMKGYPSLARMLRDKK